MKQTTFGEVKFNNVTYKLTQDAYPENYQNETAMFAHATTGEVDEYGDEIIYLVRWEWIEAEELENCADWDNPVEVVKVS